MSNADDQWLFTDRMDVANFHNGFSSLLQHLPNATESSVYEIEEVLLSTILDNISSAGIKPRPLYLRFRTDGRLALVNDQIGALDLASLRGLEFVPRLERALEEAGRSLSVRPQDHLRHAMRQRSVETLNVKLRKCHKSLEYLNFGKYRSHRLWPLLQEPPPLLPKLESICIQDLAVVLDLRGFATFLRSGCPALNLLWLDSVVDRGTEGRWKKSGLRSEITRSGCSWSLEAYRALWTGTLPCPTSLVTRTYRVSLQARTKMWPKARTRMPSLKLSAAAWRDTFQA